MSTKDFTANVISATKVVPDGNFKDSKASGIWDINEALDLIKGDNWPNVANINPASFVDALFSTFLYEGNGGTQTITNNINLSGSGGLVWIKNRDDSYGHTFIDTARGGGFYLESQNNGAQPTSAATNNITSFNTNGFSIGNRADINANANSHVSWTFRKQPKFFDVVTYTGNRQDTNSYQDITHNLGSTPGMIIVKETSSADDWMVYHRSANSADGIVLKLNSTDAASDGGNVIFDVSEINSSSFRVGNMNNVNANGVSYVAYLFAHNNDDGGFGEPGDQDIIKCGSYTGNGNADGPDVTLGFEPQWLIVKNASASSTNWEMLDVMRGMFNDGASTDARLRANSANAEASSDFAHPTPTGFKVTSDGSNMNGNGNTMIYMAIRRGGMQTPTAASDVFKVDQGHGSNVPNFESGFPVDFGLVRQTSSDGFHSATRLTGSKYMDTNSAGAESSNSNYKFDFQDGYIGSAFGTSYYAWMWKRARGYFDIVTFSGTGSARTVSHNLGVVPEMMWVKCRSNGSCDWRIFEGADATNYLRFQGNEESLDNAEFWNDTMPTASVFTVGTNNEVNGSGRTYIAFLFASVTGVSKIGRINHSGSSTDVDCGFTSGSSFVMLKRTDDDQGTADWYIYDNVRGIVAGNDPYMLINTTDAQVTNTDYIDPLASGFTITGDFTDGTYMFYAIAATS